MKALMTATAALLLALPAASASAQPKDVDAARTGGPGAELEAGEMGKGRQYGAPAGNVLVTPNNAAAIAERNDPSNKPGLNVQPDMLGTQGGAVADGERPLEPPNYRVVDEPPMRQLNEAGTGATSAKIGVGERTTD